jgi:hypothetical protein
LPVGKNRQLKNDCDTVGQFSLRLAEVNMSNTVMRDYGLAFICIVSLVLDGCAILTTRKHPGTIEDRQTLKSSGSGFTYFLPKRRVKINATGTKIPDDIRKKVVEAQNKAAEAKKTRDAAEATWKRAVAEYDGLLPSGDARAIEEAKAAVSKAKVQLDLANKALTAQSQDLARVLVEDARLVDFEAAPEPCPPLTYTFKLELQDSEPDPDHRYRATLTHLPWRDDVLTLSANEKGLLTSSKLETTDRTSDIIIEIAKAVAAFTGIVPPAPGLRPQIDTKAVPVVCPKPFIYEDIFDPAVVTDVIRVNRRLAAATGHDPSFTVEVMGKNLDDEQSVRSNQGPRNDFNVEDKAALAGLLYRQPLPYVVSVAQRYGEIKVPIQSVLIMIPNEGPVSLVPYTAGPFVKTIHDVQFKDGILTKWDANRPSEILAVVRLPLELTKAMLSTVAEIFKIHVNYTTEQKNLLDAQKVQLEAVETLRKLRNEIEQSRRQTVAPNNVQ